MDRANVLIMVLVGLVFVAFIYFNFIFPRILNKKEEKEGDKKQISKK
jgi:flagellar biosynthesis/type III secretory pathway M-ring protein FliF/YscJ